MYQDIYHQNGAQVIDGNQNTKFYSGENLYYKQVVKGYLEFKINAKKVDGTGFAIGDDL